MSRRYDYFPLASVLIFSYTIYLSLGVMYITFHGYTCVRLQEKTQVRDLTIVIDPYIVDTTIPPGIGAGNLVLATRGIEHLKTISGNPFMITGAGEYEVSDVMVYGIAWGSNVFYRIEVDDVRIVHLGLTHNDIPDSLIESFGDVDVLCIPVGGNTTLNAQQAEAVIQKIQPRLIVPMAFAVKGVDTEHDSVDMFLRVLGKKDVQPEEKYKLTKKMLPEEDMGVVVLQV